MSQFILKVISGAFLSVVLSLGYFAYADPVDLNQADARTLAENILGVGPVLAEAIVAYRLENGAFLSAEQLLEIPGVGPKILEKNEKSLLVDGKAYQN
ncbi:MAG TPA: competence protein ComEA [Gammaproteobacteria bacterium]|nr:competence protein ComEA [Gammaproteobacteria bacterium]|tara:strand:- start:102 stop:395 length:294 start_codon:yes stop_codon:yes gene_type:complete